MAKDWKWIGRRFGQASAVVILSGFFGALARADGQLFHGRDDAAASTEQAHANRLDIEPDPAIQTAIQGLILSETDDGIDEHLRVLREESGDRFSRLIPQLLYHAQRADGMRERMLPGFIIEELGIADRQLVFALIPFLGTGDADVEETVRDWLRGTEDRSPLRPSDYSHYQAFLEAEVRHGNDPPRGLVGHMYESEPGLGLLTLMRSYIRYNPAETKPILWAEHLVADVLWKWKHGFLDRGKVEPEALEALEELAQHSRWWARLYVAEIMREHPKFRTDDLIAGLVVDEDASVRAVVLSFVTPDTQGAGAE